MIRVDRATLVRQASLETRNLRSISSAMIVSRVRPVPAAFVP
jgi:hypothetical protein